MKDAWESRTYLIWLVTVAVMAAAAGVVLGLSWSDRGEGPVAVGDTIVRCQTPPELVALVEDYKTNTETAREEMNALRLQVAELYQTVGAMSGDTIADQDLRSSLPPAYVLQVDSFFETDAALTLLSAKAQSSQSIGLGIPRFVAFDLITVPYSLAKKDYYILARITILDYYDLQFDVLWDSMEAEQRP